jgi:hypothetical protein
MSRNGSGEFIQVRNKSEFSRVDYHRYTKTRGKSGDLYPTHLFTGKDSSQPRELQGVDRDCVTITRTCIMNVWFESMHVAGSNDSCSPCPSHDALARGYINFTGVKLYRYHLSGSVSHELQGMSFVAILISSLLLKAKFRMFSWQRVRPSHQVGSARQWCQDP